MADVIPLSVPLSVIKSRFEVTCSFVRSLSVVPASPLPFIAYSLVSLVISPTLIGVSSPVAVGDPLGIVVLVSPAGLLLLVWLLLMALFSVVPTFESTL